MGNAVVRALSYPEWTPALSVGDDEIDGEHRDFLAMVGRVAHLIERGDSAQELKEATVAMMATMKIHFRTEERIFAATAYPEATAHRSEHRVLLHMADHVRQMVYESEDPVYIRLSLRYLAQSMVEHLVDTDMGYKPYLPKPAV